MSSNLPARLKISLDELRMQVLGAQVLFGFQFRSLFQAEFDRASGPERIADAASLAALLVSFTVLVIPPVQHRLVEQGEASRRLLILSHRCAELALLTMAGALGCIAFSICEHLHLWQPLSVGLLCWFIALLAWFGWALDPRRPPPPRLPEQAMTDLHTKIEQMLTEARVVLPGVQAMLGFQLIVVMTPAFERLIPVYQRLHLIALALDAASVLLLIAPAAVHRIGFHGNDDARFHKIGSLLVSFALLPLALAIAADVLIAAWKLFESTWLAALAAGCSLALFLCCWYVLPIIVRMRVSDRAGSPQPS